MSITMKKLLAAFIFSLVLISCVSANQYSIQGPRPEPVLPTIYKIEMDNSYCTAFVVSTYTLVTAAHCLRDATVVVIVGGPDVVKWESHPAYDEDTLTNDFGIIIVDKPLKVVGYVSYQVINPIMSLSGHPFGMDLHTSYGIISLEAPTKSAIDAIAFPGMSGGPVYDRADGRIIGAITAIGPAGTIITRFTPETIGWMNEALRPEEGR